ncbi:phage tail protein [Dyella flava]|uniref:Phage tail protein n=1 Tax=Dyella flava TaxID=1920170 RepID=A0ABS2K0M7_9GAMM|nr:tail fiber protein [Dyella flava]MBM7124788.1 phage tail protein [Dyella flava]GLQ50833.1 microcystin dependent protein [Dyella flava]
MSSFYLGQIMLTGFGFPPKGFALCNGQLLPIVQNQALFAIIGTQFGGDGRTTFGLPDLRGRTPVGSSDSAPLGMMAGAENVTLLMANMPTHTHAAMGSTTAGTEVNPTNTVYGGSGTESIYATNTGSSVALNPATLGTAGGNVPHPNMQPSLVTNFVIALTGVFPSRS